jgi:hypothetical protein
MMVDHNGVNIPFGHGFATLDLQTWEQFPIFVGKNHNLKGYIFRGHRCSSFELVPTLLRQLRLKGVDLSPKGLSQQLIRFRLAIRGRIGLPERELLSTSELWAIGQHHGLYTPLLDWTASPFVAAFFAFEGCRTKCKRSIFAFFAKQINNVFFAELRKQLILENPKLLGDLEAFLSFAEEYPDYGRNDPVGVIAERIVERLIPADLQRFSMVTEAMDAAEHEVPRIISPLSGENPRLVNQRGLFTKFTGSVSLEQWVRGYDFGEGNGGPNSLDQEVLLKINIPGEQCESALEWLDAANINYLSLFPDIEGAARFANTRL